MAVTSSNPEVLLRKRKDNDRKRLKKQQEAKERERKAAQQKKNAHRTKFTRAEILVRNHRANELERKRINNIIAKQNDEPVSQPKAAADPKLLFVIRIPNYKRGLRIPPQAYQILRVLKLTEVDTGVFVKATENTIKLLNIVAPYIIIGKPSLASIRKLFQKRARIIDPNDNTEKAEQAENTEESKDNEKSEESEKVPTKINDIQLDNNQLVEDKFGDDLGLICTEDLVHELVSLSDNFVAITSWLLPFKLNAPVNGWDPRAKLAKLLHTEKSKKSISLSRDFKIAEVEDIDEVIDQQN